MWRSKIFLGRNVSSGCKSPISACFSVFLSLSPVLTISSLQPQTAMRMATWHTPASHTFGHWSQQNLALPLSLSLPLRCLLQTGCWCVWNCLYFLPLALSLTFYCGQLCICGNAIKLIKVETILNLVCVCVCVCLCHISRRWAECVKMCPSSPVNWPIKSWENTTSGRRSSRNLRSKLSLQKWAYFEVKRVNWKKGCHFTVHLPILVSR